MFIFAAMVSWSFHPWCALCQFRQPANRPCPVLIRTRHWVKWFVDPTEAGRLLALQGGGSTEICWKATAQGLAQLGSKGSRAKEFKLNSKARHSVSEYFYYF